MEMIPTRYERYPTNSNKLLNTQIIGVNGEHRTDEKLTLHNSRRNNETTHTSDTRESSGEAWAQRGR